jgi:hypothetical protein
VTTDDLRPSLAHLADDVSGAITSAQSTADAAGTDATQALADALDVQANLTAGISGLGVDYNLAQQAALDAENHAVAAAASEDVVVAIVRDSLPSTFDDDGKFWTAGIGGDPATRLDLPANAENSFPIVAGVGKAWRVQNDGAGNAGVSPKGYLKVYPNGVYRTRVRARATALVGGELLLSIQNRVFTEAYVHHAVLGGFGQSFTVVDEIKEFELVSFVGSNITDRVWFAPFVFSSSGANQAGDNFEVFSIEIENITDEYKTQQSVNAAATSATNAAASETATAQIAAATSVDRVAAQTARSGAEAAEARTAVSESNTVGAVAAVAADTALTVRSMNDAQTAASDALVHKNAAATSATDAANSASSASNSTTVAARTVGTAAGSNLVLNGNAQFGTDYWAATAGSFNLVAASDVNATEHPFTTSIRAENTGTATDTIGNINYAAPSAISGNFGGKTYRIRSWARVSHDSLPIQIGLRFKRADGSNHTPSLYVTPATPTDWDVYEGHVLLPDDIVEFVGLFCRVFARDGFTDWSEFTGLEIRDVTDLLEIKAQSTITQNAVATLEGNAAASIVLRAVAGSGGALFELVASDQVDGGPASVARLSADKIILDGTVKTEHLDAANITISGNMIDNNATSKRYFSTDGSGSVTTSGATQVAFFNPYNPILGAPALGFVDYVQANPVDASDGIQNPVSLIISGTLKANSVPTDGTIRLTLQGTEGGIFPWVDIGVIGQIQHYASGDLFRQFSFVWVDDTERIDPLVLSFARVVAEQLDGTASATTLSQVNVRLEQLNGGVGG